MSDKCSAEQLWNQDNGDEQSLCCDLEPDHGGPHADGTAGLFWQSLPEALAWRETMASLMPEVSVNG